MRNEMMPNPSKNSVYCFWVCCAVCLIWCNRLNGSSGEIRHLLWTLKFHCCVRSSLVCGPDMYEYTSHPLHFF